MTELLYTPLTQESAVALLVQVELVPKLRRFTYRDVTVDEAGRGSCVVTTNAAPERIQHWFSEAGAVVVQMERNPRETGYLVTFDWK